MGTGAEPPGPTVTVVTGADEVTVAVGPGTVAIGPVDTTVVITDVTPEPETVVKIVLAPDGPVTVSLGPVTVEFGPVSVSLGPVSVALGPVSVTFGPVSVAVLAGLLGVDVGVPLINEYPPPPGVVKHTDTLGELVMVDEHVEEILCSTVTASVIDCTSAT